MSCPQFEDRLHDYAGGYLSGRARQEVDEHLLVCTSCRDELTALRALLQDLSGLPRSIEAPEEVWSATKAALHRGDRSGRASKEAPRWFFRPALLAAAASVVLVVAVAVVIGRSRVETSSTAVAARGSEGAQTGSPGIEATRDSAEDDLPDRSAPSLGGSARVAPAGLVPPDLEATEAEFSRAAENLLAALEAQRDRIPPETLSLVEENLRAINEAISETHRAMESDPDNARLGRLMRAMYHTKMRLLQGAAEIPSS